MKKEHVKEILEAGLFLSNVFDNPPKILTDNGGQFRARRIEEYLSDLKIEHLYPMVAHPETNGRIERFFGTLKEEGLVEGSEGPAVVRERIADFIEQYNNQRLHEGIGYMIPRELYYGENLDIIERRKEVKEKARQKRMELNRTCPAGGGSRVVTTVGADLPAEASAQAGIKLQHCFS